MSIQVDKKIPSSADSYGVIERAYYDLTVREALISNSDQSQRTLKWFAGVFCPVALAQFSSLLFLRLGFVIGETGLLLGILQMTMAYTILVLTVLSICAISTNGAIKGGGVYFMISRTLGPEVGGSIGILFYLANVFSSALYIAGFVEGLIDNFGPEGRVVPHIIQDGYWWSYLFATCVCAFCLGVCLVGGSMFAKTNLFIFIIVFICYLSVIVTFLFHPAMTVNIPRTNKIIYYNESMTVVTANYTGLKMETFRSNLYYDHYDIDFSTGKQMSFLMVFAILFSGVTGIMNGANMSGELQKPAVAIPLGTLAATGFTFFCYSLASLLTAATCERFLLLNNFLYMQAVNYWKPFVMIGIFAACLSAALGNLIGASRILFALAKDDIFGLFLSLAKVTTKSGNPIAAVLISFVLVQLVLLIGKVNLIAPVVSVFFLLAYAMVNFACGLLDLASASNFRPTFKFFSWHTSMSGVVCCLAMCFFVHYLYSIGIFLLFIVLIIVLSFRRLDFAWGSIGQALLYHQVRKYLLLIDVRKEHVKYWRPQVLLLISNPRSQASLIQFTNLLKKGGLFIIGHVIKADFEQFKTDPASQMQKNLVTLKDFLKVKAFIDVTTSTSVREGCRQLTRLCGLGGMTINTVCLGFRDDSEPQDILQGIYLHGNNPSNRPTRVPMSAGSISEMSCSFPPANQDIAQSRSNTSSSLNDQHFRVVVGEDSPLFNKKNMQCGPNSFKMGYFRKIWNPPVDLQFMDELPEIRVLNQHISAKRTHSSAESLAEFDDHVKAQQTCDQLSKLEYIGIIADCLKLEKNICLCRHFQNMDLVSQRNKTNSDHLYIDVWPINFFQPGSGSYLDKTCMFMLQLSCILGMSPKWESKSTIRVYICLDYYTDIGGHKNLKQLWNELLVQWRIKAEIQMVAWDDIIVNLESKLGRTILSGTSSENDIKKMSAFDCTLPNTYVREVNNVIKSHTSCDTAVCFFYLPELPNIAEETNWTQYLNQLTLLTNDLPPSVLIRGQHEVITSAL